MNDIKIISCWFGEEFNRPSKIASFYHFKMLIKYVVKTTLPRFLLEYFEVKTVIPKAPEHPKCECIFFTNNAKLLSLIESRGWVPHLMTSSISGVNSVDSSLQAKSIKFLRFEPVLRKTLTERNILIYMDSRRICDDIDMLLEEVEKHAILIRTTPRKKETIWSEVDDAKLQPRYAKAMDSTIDYINATISNNHEFSESTIISNTGLIVYNFSRPEFVPIIDKLTNKVYETCLKLEQPECQIIWAIEAQRFSSSIRQIPFGNAQTRDQ